MHPKSAKLLEDIRDSAAFIREATQGKTLDDYRADRLLRRAVERSFEIIGEGLNRLTKLDPTVAQHIEHAGEIVGFRNVLIHGYDLIDDTQVWETIQGDVPRLVERVESLLRKAGTEE